MNKYVITIHFQDTNLSFPLESKLNKKKFVDELKKTFNNKWVTLDFKNCIVINTDLILWFEVDEREWPSFYFCGWSGGWYYLSTSRKKGGGYIPKKNKKTFQKLLTILKHFAIMIIVRKGDDKLKKKLKWENILLAIVGVIEGVSFINTIYTLTIRGWITGELATLAPYGIATTIVELVVVVSIALYFAEEMEK